MMYAKNQVQKHSDNHYVLQKFGTMKTDAHAFLSEELFNISEDEAWEQIYNAASYEGVIGAYMMSDCHTGYNVPIGCVVVTDNTLIQSVNGFDISCGMATMRVPGLSANNLKSFYVRERLITEIEKRIAFGAGSDRPKLMPKFSSRQGEDILRYGAKALKIDAGNCERQFLPIPDDMDLDRVQKAKEKIVPQLGSIGGGNHYTEIQCDPVDGSIWVTVHCGSRGYGYQTAEYFFREGARLRGIQQTHRESSYLMIDEPLGKEYWDYCSSAANYAIANRHIIMNGINEALEEVFQVRGELYYEISHNLVQQETLVLPDGTTKKGFVHRKGATRAFPAGHPDLVGTIWEKTGHPCIVAGSMFDGGAILFPKVGAYKSACSVNHGSGRVLARGKARRQLEHKQQRIDDEMRNVQRNFNGVMIEGIASNCSKTPLDECNDVYKGLDSVLDVLEKENIARIDRRLYPLANLKGDDSGKKSFKSRERDKEKSHR